MSIIARISNTASSVAKFMARYADEASNVADVFRAILPAIPINKNDREKIENVITQLDNAADRIGAFLDENPNVAEPVKVKASDVEEAVAKYLDANPAILEAAISKALEGNGNV